MDCLNAISAAYCRPEAREDHNKLHCQYPWIRAGGFDLTMPAHCTLLSPSSPSKCESLAQVRKVSPEVLFLGDFGKRADFDPRQSQLKR